MATTKTADKKTAKPTKVVNDELFAVIETGGKQYQVAVGDTVEVEQVKDVKTGDSLKFDRVVLVDDGENTSVGTPYLDGAVVEVEVTEVGRSKKIEVIRFRSKSRYFKNKGHRQPYMKVKVTAIK